MNDEMAKYMLREIRSVWRYDSILIGIEKDLKRINDEIEAVLSPSCPNGKTGPKVENSSVTKQTIVNSLLSDEQELVERREKFESLKREADQYRIRFLAAAEAEEIEFAKKVAEGYGYNKLKDQYHYSNPFDHALRICKRLKV